MNRNDLERTVKTMTEKNLDELFEAALRFHHYANTAYPLTPYSLRQYELHDEDEVWECIIRNIREQKVLNLYVHVPFCEQRCRFCEYVVVNKPQETDQDAYVAHLLKEMDMYHDVIGDKEIVGYDLGGGTPLYLSNENLKLITDKVKTFNIRPGVTFSIETTPAIAARDPDKLSYVKSLGYERISLGFQTVNDELLAKLNREGSKHLYDRAVENIRKAGFTRFNIDLMYGFATQTNEDFRATVRYTISKNPEYITLYRNRYKGTKLEADAGAVSLYKANIQYNIAYTELKKAGYQANNGKNTFSRVPGDLGTSDYLTTRVVDAASYVGLGLGAQSFVGNYLAYNLGCADHRLDKYFAAVERGMFPINDIADLPPDEVRSKALSVMFYFGFISMKSYRARFGEEFTERFRDEVEYLSANNLMCFSEEDPDKFMITDYGVTHLSGIIALFYSARSKSEMYDLIEKKRVSSENYDETFLKFYDRNRYEAPSVAADVVVTNRDKTQVLLITRCENPFVNKLALPGGFYVKNDRSIESCALRELKEETGVDAEKLQLEFINDAAGRDPRGWIVSVVYSTAADENAASLSAGDDALYVKWYPVSSLRKEDMAFDHYETIMRVLQLKERKEGE